MPDAPALARALSDRYVIERELGAGGMATVYLAHDIKHDRKVAVKVLRPELAAVLGADRFLNEIKITANLQHPHILPLHDSGRAVGREGGRAVGEPGEFLYYVMPFVEGESLREKLNREKQLSIEEALEITKSVAAALDYAHRQNVVHRDIKPENILLHDGQPVVADFGISLAVTAAGGTRLTETGLSLGTPQYMSPEQATGDREVDGRSDIYSLACVLYEMLAGEPPHTGPTVQAVIAKVVTTQPRPIAELRDTVPGHIAAAIHKALAKLQADRFGSAETFAGVLAERIPISDAYDVRSDLGHKTAPALSRLVPWFLAGFFALLALWFSVFRTPAPQDELRHLNVVLPDSVPLVFVGEATAGIGQPALALSPDGQWLVYVGPAGSTTRLYLRSMDRPEVRSINGTEGAYMPFFSPSGEWIAFFVGNQLKRVSLDGSQIVPVAEANWAYGGAWSEDDRIAVVTSDGRRVGIVPAFGGAMEFHFATGASGLLNQPCWLPGSESLVMGCGSGGQMHLCVMSSESGEIVRLSTGGGEPTRTESELSIAGINPRYVEPGYLVYGAATENSLMAVPFNASTFRVLGEPLQLVNGLRRENSPGALHVTISRNGDLVYASGANSVRSRFVWSDMEGTVDTLGLEPRVYGTFQLSPDKRYLAARVLPAVGRPELWIFDLERENMGSRWIETDLEILEGGVGDAAWLNSSEVVIARTGTHHDLVRVDARRASGGEVLLEGAYTLWPERVHPDGRLLVTVQPDSSSIEGYLTLIQLEDLAQGHFQVPPPLIPAAGSQGLADISADGRWLAYTSNETGPYEVYVVQLPVAQAPIRVSRNGGELPRWSPRGDGLYYRNGQRWYWVSHNESDDEPFSEPEFVLEGDYLNVAGAEFEVSADGQRLLLLEGPGERSTTTLTVITGWVQSLVRQVGGND